MPIISRFYGIAVKMFFSDHNPPHIHAIYGEFVGKIDLKNWEMTEGDLPYKALALVKEWAAKHQNELLGMWNTKQIKELPPLE